jgi:hypothetical protein
MYTFENQTRNLTTFLLGTLLYVFIYSYTGSLINISSFFKNLFGFFIYIIIADAFAMGILYKNAYNQTILTEIKETFNSPNIFKVNVENNEVNVENNKVNVENNEVNVENNEVNVDEVNVNDVNL